MIKHARICGAGRPSRPRPDWRNGGAGEPGPSAGTPSAPRPGDILISAAGVHGPLCLVKDSDPSAWTETILTNTVAAYLTSRSFIAGMLDVGWGRIVNVTSAASLHSPEKLSSAYVTSKVALNQLHAAPRSGARRKRRDGEGTAPR